MPNMIIDIPELEESVQRPVVTDVLNRIMKDTYLTNQGLPIYYPGLQESMAVNGSTMDDNVNPKLRLSNNKRIEIEVTDQVLPSQNYEYRRLQYPNIFEDMDRRITAKTIYEQVEVKVSVNYISPDRVSAFNWQRGIKQRINQFVADHMHSVDYHYVIPDEITYMLMLMHDMAKKYTQIEDEYGTYLVNHIKQRYDFIANQAGTRPRLAIEQRQTMIYGNYDFNYEVTEIERKDDAGSYGASFTYTFMYERPTWVMLMYPLVVGNLLLPKKYISYNEAYDKDTNNGIKPITLGHMQYFQFNGQPYSAQWGVGIPYFNDFTPPDTHPHYFGLFRVLCLVAKDNPRGLFHLDYRVSEDLGVYKFPDYTLAYMKAFHQKMSIPGEHLFNVQIYRWDYLQSREDTIVDGNLQVCLGYDLRNQDMWNASVDLVRGLKYLSDQAIKDLLGYPDVIKDYLDSLYPGHGNTVDDIKNWTPIDLIGKDDHMPPNGMTVMKSGIIARRMEKYDGNI